MHTCRCSLNKLVCSWLFVADCWFVVGTFDPDPSANFDRWINVAISTLVIFRRLFFNFESTLNVFENCWCRFNIEKLTEYAMSNAIDLPISHTLISSITNEEASNAPVSAVITVDRRLPNKFPILKIMLFWGKKKNWILMMCRNIKNWHGETKLLLHVHYGSGFLHFAWFIGKWFRACFLYFWFQTGLTISFDNLSRLLSI